MFARRRGIGSALSSLSRPFRSSQITEITEIAQTSPRACLTTVAEPAMAALDAIKAASGMPWWAALATGGAVVRLGLFPLTSKAQKAMAHLGKAYRQAAADERVRGDGRAMMLKVRGLMRSNPAPTSPLWIIGSPLIQASVLVYGLYSVRSMASVGGKVSIQAVHSGPAT
jgi:membrane protein insertase Oxa1/YidC/SpoIIIJ